MFYTCNKKGHIILISYFAAILAIMELPKNSQIRLLLFVTKAKHDDQHVMGFKMAISH